MQTMDKAELQAWLRLLLTPGVGNESARKLLAAFGSAQAIFEQSAATLRETGSARLVQAIQAEPEDLQSQLTSTLDWLYAGLLFTVLLGVLIGGLAWLTGLA